MIELSEQEKLLARIETYILKHFDDEILITFPKGDSYSCLFVTDDWDDNEEELDSPTYEEWYVLIFRVKEILVPGPNKDPRYEFLEISEKKMPSQISCGGVLLYQDGEPLVYSIPGYEKNAIKRHPITEMQINLLKTEWYVQEHSQDPVTITYPEGDSYICRFDSNSWDDNGAESNSPNYEKWYVLDFRVREVLAAGPNKEPQAQGITISEKLMPYKVQCGDRVLYENGKLLI